MKYAVFAVVLALVSPLPCEAASSDCLELHAAAIGNDVARIEALLSSGTDIECVDETADDARPLIRAAGGASVEATRLLVDRGASINARDRSRWTALRHARERRDQFEKRGVLPEVVSRLNAIIMFLTSKGATE